jgi:class 3 adenylate cyclase
VRCAGAIAEEIKSLGIDIRAGLHTGECEIMNDDVGGIAVHIGARVAALAGAGEVLVSSTVKDLVAGSGLRFGPRGSRSLKGIPGEWQIFAAER